MGDMHVKLDVILSFLAFPFDSVPHPPSASVSLFSSTLHPGPHSATSPLPKEKCKWEGKQKSLGSELTELRETLVTLQSRLRQAELQGLEAQVRRPRSGAGAFSRRSPRGPGCSSRPSWACGPTPSIGSAPRPSARGCFPGCLPVLEGHDEGPGEFS